MFVCFFVLRVTISSFYNICLIFNLKFGGLIPFRWEHFNNILSFSCTVSRKVNINMCTIISLILETECVHTSFFDSRTWNTCWHTLLCTSMETLILWAIYFFYSKLVAQIDTTGTIRYNQYRNNWVTLLTLSY